MPKSDCTLDPKLDQIEDKIHKLLLIRDKLKISPNKSRQKSSSPSPTRKSKSPKPVAEAASTSSSDETTSSELVVVNKPRLVGILKQQPDTKTSSTSSNETNEIVHKKEPQPDPSLVYMNDIIKMLKDQIVVYQQTQDANMKVIGELKSNLEKAHDDQIKNLKGREELIQKNDEVC